MLNPLFAGKLNPGEEGQVSPCLKARAKRGRSFGITRTRGAPETCAAISALGRLDETDLVTGRIEEGGEHQDVAPNSGPTVLGITA
jgi:hypothetical protein